MDQDLHNHFGRTFTQKADGTNARPTVMGEVAMLKELVVKQHRAFRDFAADEEAEKQELRDLLAAERVEREKLMEAYKADHAECLKLESKMVRDVIAAEKEFLQSNHVGLQSKVEADITELHEHLASLKDALRYEAEARKTKEESLSDTIESNFKAIEDIWLKHADEMREELDDYQDDNQVDVGVEQEQPPVTENVGVEQDTNRTDVTVKREQPQVKDTEAANLSVVEDALRASQLVREKKEKELRLHLEESQDQKHRALEESHNQKHRALEESHNQKHRALEEAMHNEAMLRKKREHEVLEHIREGLRGEVAAREALAREVHNYFEEVIKNEKETLEKKQAELHEAVQEGLRGEVAAREALAQETRNYFQELIKNEKETREKNHEQLHEAVRELLENEQMSRQQNHGDLHELVQELTRAETASREKTFGHLEELHVAETEKRLELERDVRLRFEDVLRKLDQDVSHELGRIKDQHKELDAKVTSEIGELSGGNHSIRNDVNKKTDSMLEMITDLEGETFNLKRQISDSHTQLHAYMRKFVDTIGGTEKEGSENLPRHFGRPSQNSKSSSRGGSDLGISGRQQPSGDASPMVASAPLAMQRGASPMRTSSPCAMQDDRAASAMRTASPVAVRTASPVAVRGGAPQGGAPSAGGRLTSVGQSSLGGTSGIASQGPPSPVGIPGNLPLASQSGASSFPLNRQGHCASPAMPNQQVAQRQTSCGFGPQLAPQAQVTRNYSAVYR
eukprot:TRINITY_DN11818_c0_g2_i1.p1 TRINITY_DN11818_c0_g2~~TRINITY_DN11818_c0_g2_i1.p1  ORF type:complete len:804 (-),score=168.69 TRINITY_DN11818_c0_g2_i1:31-2253(-)